MKRRKFFSTLLGLVVAPVVVARVISEYKPKPKFVVFKPRSLGITTMVGYKGSQFLEPGYVYAPYIPLTFTSVPITAKKRKLKDGWSCELSQDITRFHSIS